MPGDVDKSLLDRLAALRGSPGAAAERAPPTISVDTIQRAKTPTREDALAARLKSLRQGSDSPSSTRATPGSTPPRVNLTQRKTPVKGKEEEFDDADAVFMTDDDVLAALLGDSEASSSSPTKQTQTSGGNDNDDNVHGDNDNAEDDAKVKALLEELSKSIPKDSEEKKDDDNDSDDSDGEKMTTEADAVIARLRDEMEVEASLSKTPEDKEEEEGQPTFSDSSLALPSVPQDLATATTTSTSTPPSSNIDDITARLSALRASSEPPASDLPSVPTSLPVKDNPNRLKTTTKYTDEDMDSWCTVCSEDATLRCLGCVEDDKPEGDPYCARCWKEMHLGPTPAFDDRSHRAVQFSRKQGKEKRVALGAS